jgi:GWxTD domain-containing protein
MMMRPAWRAVGWKEDNVMRRSTLLVALVALAIAASAGAQLSQTNKDWPNGPVRFLMTDSEKKAYSVLKSDVEAKDFIELFWARRDPDLATVTNEAKVDFDMRVEAADKLFTTDKLKGSLSDRGKVLILMGRPSARANLKPGDAAADSAMSSEFAPQGRGEDWMYKVPGKKGKEEEIHFVFVESSEGAGDFALDRSNRRNVFSMKYLAETPERLIKNPTFTNVALIPRPGLLPGSKAAVPDQLKVFDGEARPWPAGAAATVASGVQSEQMHPIWVFLQLPDAAPVAALATGRVRKADGNETVGSFGEVAVTPISAASARAYEFSFAVPAAQYKVDLALLDAQKVPIAVTTLDATSEAASTDGTFVSQIFTGAEVRQESQARVGSAFNVGGWHILPRLDNSYKSDENLSYFCFIVRPAKSTPTAAAGAPAAAPGEPKIELSMALWVGDKKQDETQFQPASVSRIANTDMWMFGSSLPMNAFRRNVPFRIDITVRDANANVARTTKIPFLVLKEAAAPAAATSPAAKP